MHYLVNGDALIVCAQGKPFLRVLRDTAAADGGGGGGCVGVGTWNFNVSHHGDFVCIAAHPSRLVGADVVDIDVNVTNNRFAAPKEFIMMFSQQLTAGEINVILRYRPRFELNEFNESNFEYQK